MDSNTKKKLITFLEAGQVDQALSFLKQLKPESPVRTGTQNNAIHLWYEQVAQTCRDNSVDAKLVMSKVIRMDMTADFIKGMWKNLQLALFGKKSTTELKKTGQIDRIEDHFIRFFADEFQLELPPFPNDEKKQLENLAGIRVAQHNNLKNEDYQDEVLEVKF